MSTRQKKIHNAEDFFQTYKRTIWQELSPGERLRCSWALRPRLKDPEKIHF